MKLGIRLSSAAEMVPEMAYLMDVGCDHAYLPIALMKEGRISAALASDIRKGPLEAAARNIRAAGLEDRILTVLADGIPENWRELLLLSREEGEGHKEKEKRICCTILGMGGLMIASICEKGAHMAEGRENITDLVISPQRDADACRRSLIQCGFGISEERYVEEEGKGYPILHAVRGSGYRVLSEEEAYFGPVLIRKMPSLYRKCLERRLELLLSIEEGLPEHAFERRKEIERERTALQRIL